MELRRLEGAKRLRDLFLDRVQQFWRDAGRLEPGQREVRRERTFFQGEAEAVYGVVDVRGKRFQIGGRFHSGPQDARALLIREKAEGVKFEIHRFGGTDSREHVLQWAQFRGFSLAKKFQGDVQILQANPLHLRGDGPEILQETCVGGTNGRGNLDGDEKSHGAAWFSLRD